MKNLILIGGGGHCKSCIDAIELTNEYRIVGVLDVESKIGQKVLAYEIIGADNDISKYVEQDYYFLITVGQLKDNHLRVKLFNELKRLNAKIATVISPLAHVSKYAEVQEGSIVLSGALVNAAVKIGANCIINSNALIEHDATIGNHCHISTGAKINGGVTIEDNVFIGSNSTVVQCCKISQGSFIKANSLVK